MCAAVYGRKIGRDVLSNFDIEGCATNELDAWLPGLVNGCAVIRGKRLCVEAEHGPWR